MQATWSCSFSYEISNNVLLTNIILRRDTPDVKRHSSGKRRSWYNPAEMSAQDDGSPNRPGPPARDPVPEPPWRADARARAEPRLPLTRHAIVEAALRVLDR